MRKDIGHFLTISLAYLLSNNFPLLPSINFILFQIFQNSYFQKKYTSFFFQKLSLNPPIDPIEIQRHYAMYACYVEWWAVLVDRHPPFLSSSWLPAMLQSMIGLGRPCPFCQATLRYRSTNWHENINSLHGLERLSRMPPPSLLSSPFHRLRSTRRRESYRDPLRLATSLPCACFEGKLRSRTIDICS